jgi:hypothetical protein
MHHSMIARTQTTDAQIAGLHRYNLAENTPPRFRKIYCATDGCDRQADIWADDITPLCGRCYLTSISDTGEVEQ